MDVLGPPLPEARFRRPLQVFFPLPGLVNLLRSRGSQLLRAPLSHQFEKPPGFRSRFSSWRRDKTSKIVLLIIFYFPPPQGACSSDLDRNFN